MESKSRFPKVIPNAQNIQVHNLDAEYTEMLNTRLTFRAPAAERVAVSNLSTDSFDSDSFDPSIAARLTPRPAARPDGRALPLPRPYTTVKRLRICSR